MDALRSTRGVFGLGERPGALGLQRCRLRMRAVPDVHVLPTPPQRAREPRTKHAHPEERDHAEELARLRPCDLAHLRSLGYRPAS